MKITHFIFAFALGSTFVACHHNEDVYEGPAPDKSSTKELLPESSYLDFSTTKTVSFDVQYGELGERVLVEIFDKMPELTWSETEGQTIVGTPIYKMFTD